MNYYLRLYFYLDLGPGFLLEESISVNYLMKFQSNSITL